MQVYNLALDEKTHKPFKLDVRYVIEKDGKQLLDQPEDAADLKAKKASQQYTVGGADGAGTPRGSIRCRSR